MISDQRTRAYVAKRTATAEMSPHGVDVCMAVLGQTWTPALERTGVTYDPETDMLAEDVADGIIANIANGPTYVVGARNQAIAARMARPPDVGPDDRRTHQRPRGPHERHALLCDGSGSTC
jgi:predicted TIM-barrel enzyme